MSCYSLAKFVSFSTRLVIFVECEERKSLGLDDQSPTSRKVLPDETKTAAGESKRKYAKLTGVYPVFA